MYVEATPCKEHNSQTLTLLRTDSEGGYQLAVDYSKIFHGTQVFWYGQKLTGD